MGTLDGATGGGCEGDWDAGGGSGEGLSFLPTFADRLVNRRMRGKLTCSPRLLRS